MKKTTSEPTYDSGDPPTNSESTDKGDSPPSRIPKHRHLRVGLLLGPRSTRVTSVALAAGVPAQLIAAGHPWLAVVKVGIDVVHLARFQDPFLQRSTRTREGGDHHLSTRREGLIVVSIPFESLTELTGSGIDVLDLRRHPNLVTREEILSEYRHHMARGEAVRSVGFAEIAQSRDWPRVAAALGIAAPPGTFEVYRDRDGEYRWRLRAAGGRIVATSGEGFRTRTECEAEIIWVRRYAVGSLTRAVD